MPPRKGAETMAAAQINLSYHDVAIARDGTVMTREQIRGERVRRGLCVDCTVSPVQLFDIKKNRLNPLWTTRVPCTKQGESLEGRCLKCNPELDPNYTRRTRRPRAGRRHRPTDTPMYNASSPQLYGNGQRSPKLPSQPAPPGVGLSPVPTFENSSPELSMEQSPNGSDTRNQREIQFRPPRPAETTTMRSPVAAFLDPPNARELPREMAPADDDHEQSITSIFADESGRSNQSGDLTNNSGRNESADNFYNNNNTANVVEEVSERIFARCQRESFARQVRPSSMRNLVVPPEDASPVLSNLIRSTKSPIRDDGCAGDATPAEQNSLPEPTPSDGDINYANVVNEVESLIKDMSGMGDTDLTSDILVNSMKEYGAAVPVQLFCLGTIWDLCKDSEAYKSSIISTSAPDDILVSMKTHMTNAEIQERACGALWSLSVNQANRIIIIRAGAPARIIRAIIDHQRNEQVIRTAVGCLRTLSPESEVRQLLGSLQGIKHVCDAMNYHRSVACVQRDGCAFLSNSAVDLEQQEVTLASDYELRTMVDAMKAHKDEPSVMAGASFALKNYTYEERNVRKLSSITGVVDLLDYAAQHSTDNHCKRDATIVLERVQNSRLEDQGLEQSAYDSLMDSATDVHVVLDVMKEYEWSAMIQGGGLQSLATLASNSHSQREKVNATSVLKKIVQTLNLFPKDRAVTMNGFALLEELTKDDEKSRLTVIDSGGCKTVAAAIAEHLKDLEVMIALSGALRRLSVEFTCWFNFEEQGEGAATRMVHEFLKAHRQSTVVQENGSEALAKFSVFGAMK